MHSLRVAFGVKCDWCWSEGLEGKGCLADVEGCVKVVVGLIGLHKFLASTLAPPSSSKWRFSENVGPGNFRRNFWAKDLKRQRCSRPFLERICPNGDSWPPREGIFPEGFSSTSPGLVFCF